MKIFLWTIFLYLDDRLEFLLRNHISCFILSILHLRHFVQLGAHWFLVHYCYAHVHDYHGINCNKCVCFFLKKWIQWFMINTISAQCFFFHWWFLLFNTLVMHSILLILNMNYACKLQLIWIYYVLYYNASNCCSKGIFFVGTLWS